MAKTTQKSENPYKNTDSDKRYYTYDYYLRKQFGCKVAKIPLDIGLTCPNIDGKCGVGGCIYCSDRGSGDFAGNPLLTVSRQYEIMRQKLSSKWNTEKCIAYFQAHTNTYAPLDFLRSRFEEALLLDGVVGMNIATRADCVGDDVCRYLEETARRTVLTVELGLQSSSDTTALLINRGHTYAQFLDGYTRLRMIAGNAKICIHMIFGLPGENRDDMMKTVRDVAALEPDQVKIHLLHVLRGTIMADIYNRGEYLPLEKEEYVSLVADALELLPPDTVIARLTGDGMGENLIAPEWSRKKVSVINDIDKALYARGSFQGQKYRIIPNLK